MNARDELFGLWLKHGVTYESDSSEGRELVEAILAAGYVKHRTITTIEELDALAVGSMILDSDPDASRKRYDGLWVCLSDPEWGHESKIISGSLPAVVLYEPGAQP
jgi:hypothetical protein